VTDHRDRRDDTGRPEQQGRPRPYSAADLRARLDQLPESHPSSPGYRGGSGQPGFRNYEFSGSRPADADRSAGPASHPRADRSRTGWDEPGVADHPARPGPDTIRLTDDRKRHILEGDPQGGGHRHGTGQPGKTEFPAAWDDVKIVRAILDVARHPEERPVQQNWNGRWRVRGAHDGVEIVSILEPDGRVWSGWPLDGGPGVVKNPKKGTS
jgi:Bacterial EndoU nuclease